MLDAALFLTLLILGTRAFIALRREHAVLQEFGQTGRLSAMVLLYPVGPIFVLLASSRLPMAVVYGTALTFFIVSMLVSSKQNSALERSGTDRVKGAMAATATASAGALVGIIYICLAALFYLVGLYFAAQPLGA